MRDRVVEQLSHPFLGSAAIVMIGITLLLLVRVVVFGPDGWQERWCEYNLGAGAGYVGDATELVNDRTQDCTDIDQGIWEPWKLVPWVLFVGQLLATLLLALPYYLRR